MPDAVNAGASNEGRGRQQHDRLPCENSVNAPRTWLSGRAAHLVGGWPRRAVRSGRRAAGSGGRAVGKKMVGESSGPGGGSADTPAASAKASAGRRWLRCVVEMCD
jgi:hypothetical protein